MIIDVNLFKGSVNNFIKEMSYVKQICDGYNKKSLMGNWYEERIYPTQKFRQEQAKAARQKDSEIMCFNNQGVQRGLPRIQRRSKWETAGRIVLDDHYHIKQNQTHSAYPYNEIVTSKKQMERVFAKKNDSVDPTPLHQHSQLRPRQKNYSMMNSKNFYLLNTFNLKSNGSFKQINPSTAEQDHQSYFDTTYKNSYSNIQTNPEYQNMSVNHDKRFKSVKNDIQTSLNLNVGLHNIHPKQPEDGRFRHIRKDVTINHHY